MGAVAATRCYLCRKRAPIKGRAVCWRCRSDPCKICGERPRQGGAVYCPECGQLLTWLGSIHRQPTDANPWARLARLARYESRAAAGLPLFEETPS